MRLAVVGAAALGLAACGGGNGGDSRLPTAARGAAPTGASTQPLERVEDVIARLRGAATAESCEAVKGLMHSLYGEMSDPACLTVRSMLGELGDPRGEIHGTGAVVSYTASGRRRIAVLALDADRHFHVDFIDDATGGSGPLAAAGFTASARRVVRAMQRGDCDTFLRHVHRSIGLGVGGDGVVCRRVTDEPIRRELVADPGILPEPLGGNGQVAFFRLRTAPDRLYTMVMTTQDPRAARVPGASRYVLVNALPAQ